MPVKDVFLVELLVSFTTIFQGFRPLLQTSYFKGKHLVDASVASINDLDFLK